jgi:hypothetical protein
MNGTKEVMNDIDILYTHCILDLGLMLMRSREKERGNRTKRYFFNKKKTSMFTEQTSGKKKKKKMQNNICSRVLSTNKYPSVGLVW